MVVLADQVRKLKDELSQDYFYYVKKTGDDCVQKYCSLNYIKNVAKHRIYALKHKLKRHWDGEDGAGFAHWLLDHSYAGDTSEMDEIMKELDKSIGGGGGGGGGGSGNNTPRGAIKRSDSNNSLNSNASQKDTGLAPEYTFADTDDMSKYDHYIYTRYRTERDSSLFAMFE